MTRAIKRDGACRPAARELDRQKILYAAVSKKLTDEIMDTVLAKSRRRPIVHPQWLSDAAAYSDFVKRGIAPKSVLFSRNARRSKRSDVDAGCAAGSPSVYASIGERGGVHK